MRDPGAVRFGNPQEHAMATRGHIQCIGQTREGNYIVKPDPCAVGILVDSGRSGAWIEVHLPSKRHKSRKQPTLKLVGESPDQPTRNHPFPPTRSE